MRLMQTAECSMIPGIQKMETVIISVAGAAR